MFMPIFSSLLVSVDAFFIGLSLGFNKRCRFLYLVIINILLFGLCMIGFFAAGFLYEVIPVEPDLVVGFAFISLGIWTIGQFFYQKNTRSAKTIVLVGFVMSIEAMLITMGLTLIFLPNSTFLIPLTVALAHFGYSLISFCLARSAYAKKIPFMLSQIISGGALVVYGLMAIFVDF